jgi:PAS domain S-box-containing protein
MKVETAERARDEVGRTRRLLAHHAVTSALAVSASLDEAGPRILDAICDSLGWDLGALWRVDAPSGVIRCTEVRSHARLEFPGFEASSRRTEFPPGLGFPGRIWASREPCWIADVREDSTFLRARVAEQDGLRAAVGFPLIVRDDVLGVAEFLTEEIRPPDEELLSMMAAIGSQVGQFIERTEAEQAVRESEARKAAMLESALDCVIAIDHEGRITEFNPAAEEAFGYSREQVMGERMVDLLVPPALRDAHRAGFARYLRSGDTRVLGRRVEMLAMRADGSEFPVELAITRVPLPGKPVFTAYVRDIAERRRREDELRRSQELYRLVVENTKDMITLIDPHARVLFASPSWADVLGYSSELLRGTNALELVHPDDLQTAEAAIAACLSSGRASVAAVRLRHLDGSWRVLEGVVSGIHEAGETTMILATSRDVSNRVRAEDELRQSRELYRTVVENTRDLVALLDLEGRIVYASPSHEEKLGRSAPELEGTTFLDLVHPQDLEAALGALTTALSGARAPFSALRLRHQTGRWLVTEGTASGIVADQGRVTMFLLSARDLTEREQAKLAEERRERAEREFVVNAAHELRTPLAAISAAVEVLEAGAKHVPEERDSFLADVGREASRMQRLVHALLLLARVQTLHETLLCEPVELRALLMESAQTIVPADGVGIEVVCPPGLIVLAERTILEAAMSNLGANAAAHTARGHIRLAGSRDPDGSVQIEVSDTGTGMSTDEADRVFDRFYRVGKRDARGFGLGLAIVRQAVEVHDGTLGLETAPGIGTTVRITLPSRQREER